MTTSRSWRTAGFIITNSYNVKNENSTERENIYVCTGTRRPWPKFWQEIRAFA